MPVVHRLIPHAACPGSLAESRCKQRDLHILNGLQGLDYVVTQAAAHGMRLVLTFTNYLAAYGGAQQYVNWYGGGTITDFWQRSDIRQACAPKHLCRSILTLCIG